MGEAKLAFLKVKIFRGRVGVLRVTTRGDTKTYAQSGVKRVTTRGATPKLTPSLGFCVSPRVVTHQNLRRLWLGDHTIFT